MGRIGTELEEARKEALMILQAPASFVKVLMSAPEHVAKESTDAISRWLCFLLLCYLPRHSQRFSVGNADSQLNVTRYVRSYVRNLMSYPVAAYRYSQFERGNDRDYDVVAETPNTLFHGTNTLSLPDIDRRGLDPALAGRCWDISVANNTYLTDSMHAAEFFARTAFFAHGGDPVILCINVKNFKERLVVDIRDFGKVVGAFDMYRRFSLGEIVPPNRIRNRYILPREPSLFAILSILMDRLRAHGLV